MKKLECVACGRVISNDPAASNVAQWVTEVSEPVPYCADSKECERDAEEIAGLR